MSVMPVLLQVLLVPPILGSVLQSGSLKWPRLSTPFPLSLARTSSAHSV